MRAETFHRTFALIVVTAIAICPPALAEDGPIIGQASVIDGDTIEIHGTRIRLSGIDAPESDQVCVVAGRDQPCGRHAAFFLSDLIGRSTVYCSGDGDDRYRRTLAHCEVGGQDVGAAMVRAGQALAFVRYSREYVPQETAARTAKAGMWAADFLAPRDWRRLQRQ
jgi:endonuclease YncB( thermonuclease family)